MLEQDQADDEQYETVEMVDGMNNVQTIALNASSEEGTGDELTERLNTVEFDENLVAQEAAEPMMIKSLVPND